MPSTMTFSPSRRPEVMTTSVSWFGPVWIAALLDLVLVVDHQHVIAGLVDLQGRLRNDQARLLLPLADHRR